MPTTKPAVWRQRRTELERLGLARFHLACCCGCSTCNDSDRIEELQSLIRHTEQRIEDLGNQCCTRAEESCSR